MTLAGGVFNPQMYVSKAVNRPLCGALLAAAVSLAACSSSKSADPNLQPSPPAVTVLRIEPQQVPLKRSFTGRLSAYREANVLARVPGVLLKRLYREGSEVKAGEPLFEIDPAPHRVALDGALAALAQARASAANAHIIAQRDRELASDHLISLSQLDRDEAAERSTAAGMKEAEAIAETARINLGYTNVIAPIAGIAGEQQVTEGALVGQGVPTLLTTVDQIDPIYVNFEEASTLVEEISSAIQSGRLTAVSGNGARVQLTLADGTLHRLAGVLDYRASTVDVSTGALALRAVMPNPDHSLLPGMFVNLTLVLAIANDAFLIPQRALQRDARGAYVLAIGRDCAVEMKRVRTEGTAGTDWVISSGLLPGDQVIVGGIQIAHPGAKVAVSYEPPVTDPNLAATGARHAGVAQRCLGAGLQDQR